jgi:hypothetical protein
MPKSKRIPKKEEEEEEEVTNDRLLVLFESFDLASISTDATDAYLHGHDLTGEPALTIVNSLTD